MTPDRGRADAGTAATRPWRIAILHPDFRTAGGAERVVLDHADTLGTLGWDVRLITCGWHPSAFAGRLDAYSPILVPRPRSGILGGIDPRARAAIGDAIGDADLAMAHNHPMSAYLGLVATDAVRLWYCHEPRRRLHALETSAALQAALASGRIDRRVAAHATMLRKLAFSRLKRRLSPRHRGRRTLDLQGVARLDAIWANSAATARQVAQVYGREAQVAYPAVEVPMHLPTPAPEGAAMRILVMGGFAPAKGFGGLLEGYARVPSALRTRLHLEVVGDGGERAGFERRAAALGLTEQVHFHGRLTDTDLVALRGACHAFAALPIDEPFGIVFAEAAAHGLVMIGPDHGGPREILLDGAAGLLADPFDPRSVADAFSRYATLDTQERDRLRRAAYDQAAARFDRHVWAGALEPALLALLHRARRRPAT
jgi:glycosyltransferase involved in cell wall biosynthesis